MRSSPQVRPISYLERNAAEVLRMLAEQREPVIITQNGEARAVIYDVASNESTQEALALQKVLVLGIRDIEEGRATPMGDAVARIRARRRQRGWCATRYCSPLVRGATSKRFTSTLPLPMDRRAPTMCSTDCCR